MLVVNKMKANVVVTVLIVFQALIDSSKLFPRALFFFFFTGWYIGFCIVWSYFSYIYGSRRILVALSIRFSAFDLCVSSYRPRNVLSFFFLDIVVSDSRFC